MRYKTGSRLVYDVGINDADYEVQPRINGKQVKCRYYVTWHSMMTGCYSNSYQNKFPTYIGCSVCPEWRYFMNFRAWMVTQNWKGLHLDKDLLVLGNKVYSPSTCIFITPELNSMISGSGSNHKSLPIGVSWDKKMGKYRAGCSFRDFPKHIGYYDTVNEASKQFKAKKLKYAKIIASEQANPKVAEAIIKTLTQKETQNVV